MIKFPYQTADIEKMKLLYFILAFCTLFPPSSYAQEVEPVFVERWDKSKEEKRKGPLGKVSQKVLTRSIRLADGQRFPIATLSLLELPINKDTENFGPNEAMELYRQAYGLSQSRLRRVNDAHVMEGDWVAGKRFIKIFYHRNEERIHISIALMRIRYARKLAIESEILQRSLSQAEVNQATPQWIKKLLSKVYPGLISSAHAQGLDGFLNPDGNNDNGNSNGFLTPQEQQQAIEDLTQALDRSNENLEESNEHWGTSNEHWGDTNEIMREYQEIIGDLNQNWGQTNQHLAQTNEILGSMANTLEDLTRPEKLFMLSASAAAGAALGSAAMGLLINGVKQGAVFLYQLASGKLRDARNEELLERFIEAREKYEQTNDQIKQLEAGIDALIQILEQLRLDELEPEEIIINLKMLQRRRQRQLRRNLEQEEKIDDFLYAGGSAYQATLICERELMDLMRQNIELEGFLDKLENVINVLENDTQALTCQNLNHIIDEIIQSEMILDQVRSILLESASGYLAELSSNQQEHHDRMHDLMRGRLDRRQIQEMRRTMQEMQERHQNRIERMQRDYGRICRDAIKEDYAWYNNRRAVCRDIFNEVTQNLSSELINHGSSTTDHNQLFDNVLNDSIENINRRSLEQRREQTQESLIQGQARQALYRAAVTHYDHVKSIQNMENLIQNAQTRREGQNQTSYQILEDPFVDTIASAQEFVNQLQRELTTNAPHLEPEMQGKIDDLNRLNRQTRFDELNEKKELIRRFCL